MMKYSAQNVLPAIAEAVSLTLILVRPSGREFFSWLLHVWHALFLLILLRRILYPRMTTFSAKLWAAGLFFTLSFCLVSQSALVPAVLQGAFLLFAYHLAEFPVPSLTPAPSVSESPRSAVEKKETLTDDSPRVIRRQSRGRSFSGEDRWLDSVNQCFFIVRRDLSLSLVNRRGQDLLHEFQTSFPVLTSRLIEADEPHRTLQTFIDGLLSESPEGETTKAVFGYMESQEQAEPSKFKVGLYLNYKAYLFRLHDSVLIIMREKTQSSDINITQKLEKATYCTLSHELKTQLNGIIGNLELLEESIPQESKIHYKVARSSSFILSSHLNDLFDYLQLRDKGLKLHYGELQMYDFLRDIGSICEAQAAQKGVRFVLSPTRSVPHTMIADKIRIHQVLLNVLSKAIDYTDNGTITLNVYLFKPKHVCFEVVGEGSGMYTWLLSNMEQSSPGCRRRKHTDATEDEATSNIEGMYLQISQMICREMGTRLVVENASNGNSVLRFVVRDGYPTAISPSLTARVQSRRYSMHEKRANKDPSLERTQYGVEGVFKCQKVENINIINLNLSGQNTPTIKNSMVQVQSVITQCMDMQSECGDVPSESVVDSQMLSTHSISPHHMDAILSGSSGSLMSPRRCDPTSNVRVAIAEEAKKSVTKAPVKRKIRRTTMDMPCNLLKVAMRRADPAEADDSTGILIVDDNTTNRFVLKSLLKNCRHNSIEAVNGLEAVKLIEKYIAIKKLHELKLIFMDLQMPKMNGIQATRMLISMCNESKLSPPPVIGISSDISEEDRTNFFRAGIHEFLNKPIHKDQVVLTLSKYVK